jgi:hypothetical protein
LEKTDVNYCVKICFVSKVFMIPVLVKDKQELKYVFKLIQTIIHEIFLEINFFIFIKMLKQIIYLKQ